MQGEIALPDVVRAWDVHLSNSLRLKLGSQSHLDLSKGATMDRLALCFDDATNKRYD